MSPPARHRARGTLDFAANASSGVTPPAGDKVHSALGALASAATAGSGVTSPAADDLPDKDRELLVSVRALKRYPKRCKNPQTSEPREENALAKRISADWNSLHETTQEELQTMREQDREREEQRNAEALMTEVRAFGRWPREHTTSDDPKCEAERKLAHDIRKALEAARLPPAFVSELKALRERAEAEEAEARERRKQQTADALMTDVRALGRWPRSRKGASHAAERSLAARVRKALASGDLSKADEAKLEELQWMHVRACQVANSERKW